MIKLPAVKQRKQEDKLHSSLKKVEGILGVFTKTIKKLQDETAKLIITAQKSDEIAEKHQTVANHARSEVERIGKVIDKISNIVE